MLIHDFTGQSWVTVFHESAVKILGVCPEILMELLDTNPDEYAKVFENAFFKTWKFRMVAEYDTYNVWSISTLACPSIVHTQRTVVNM